MFREVVYLIFLLLVLHCQIIGANLSSTQITVILTYNKNFNFSLIYDAMTVFLCLRYHIWLKFPTVHCVKYMRGQEGIDNLTPCQHCVQLDICLVCVEYGRISGVGQILTYQIVSWGQILNTSHLVTAVQLNTSGTLYMYEKILNIIQKSLHVAN